MFQKTDVSNRDQVQELLGAAQQTFGAIYTDVSNAHMNREDIFKEETDKSAERLLPGYEKHWLELGRISIHGEMRDPLLCKETRTTLPNCFNGRHGELP
jgi:hypothetical protein